VILKIIINFLWKTNVNNTVDSKSQHRTNIPLYKTKKRKSQTDAFILFRLSKHFLKNRICGVWLLRSFYFVLTLSHKSCLNIHLQCLKTVLCTAPLCSFSTMSLFYFCTFSSRRGSLWADHRHWTQGQTGMSHWRTRQTFHCLEKRWTSSAKPCKVKRINLWIEKRQKKVSNFILLFWVTLK